MTIPIPQPNALPAPQPSAGINLSVRGFPQVPFSTIQSIQAQLIALASPFTLQATLMNGLTGGESLAELEADLAALPPADLPTDSATQSVIALAIAAITEANNPVGASVAAGLFTPGPGFTSWSKSGADLSLPVTVNGAQYQVVFRQVA